MEPIVLPVIERRIVPLDRVEIRADGAKKMLVGHTAVFNRDSEEMWGFRERIAPGCFAKTLGKDDIRGLFNHNPDNILGRNNLAKTLRLNEDAVGLAFEIDLPDTQCARDLQVSIERKDITGCSFSFRTLLDEWDYTQDPMLRTLKEVELFDVGPVTFPAYPDTDVSARDRSAMEGIAKAALERKEAAKRSASTGATVSVLTRRRQLDLVDV